MPKDRPIKVAIIGGGCASVTTAFELTRPIHKGKYQVTIYQLGWRLGGKGASGRGPAGRIEEHGLHIWLGFYENAFRLMRECYARTRPRSREMPDRDLARRLLRRPVRRRHGALALGRLVEMARAFPPGAGTARRSHRGKQPVHLPQLYRPHDHAAAQPAVRRLYAADARRGAEAERLADHAIEADRKDDGLLKIGVLSTAAGLSEALGVLAVAVKSVPAFPEKLVEPPGGSGGDQIRERLEDLVGRTRTSVYKSEVIDLVLAFMTGAVRFRLMTDPRGLSAIDGYECREWLRMNGASERSLNSAFVRGLYDLALAYEDGDPARPGLAAGQALRGGMRMFFTYRGALFWKMRAGMGDCVFAPFYEVLKRRGVRFEFFHRLENVKLAAAEKLAPGERPYVEALEFDVQAKIKGGGEYQPLVDVTGVPCWPSMPDFAQLVDGERMQQEGWRFESHWDRRKVETKTLR